VYDVSGDEKMWDPSPKWVRGTNGLEETTGKKTLNSFWQVDKSSSSESSKLISEESRMLPDRST
jgi:hypothetical protein